LSHDGFVFRAGSEELLGVGALDLAVLCAMKDVPGEEHRGEAEADAVPLNQQTKGPLGLQDHGCQDKEWLTWLAEIVLEEGKWTWRGG